MKKLFLFSLVLLGFTAGAFAQLTNSATATATATIITPITIQKDVDMNFSYIAPSASDGTVVLGTDNSRTASNCTIYTTGAFAGSPKAASFTVSGMAGATYSIQLPTSDITLNGSVSGTMTVGTFVSNPTPTGTLSGVTGVGSQTLLVGATLNVGANQAAGTYTNTTDLIVTVNYN